MSADNPTADFWTSCRAVMGGLPETPPEAWAFGATAEQAEELLALVLAGTKTATASSAWDYEVDGEPLPAEGDYSILLDGRGIPRAVIQTTAVSIVPFDEVTEAHAHAEGEGDLSLAWWRDAHERFWRSFSTSSQGFDARMPVVCEEFRLVYPAAA
ncbi:ASCH domain-containing protein [Cnuibacter sp. UC19_7]|uniref:ASCH domain-containing protein n=1 Tax=Cnuibacter sp. UC19_7 TaxID=3350166 RepID=UPI00366FCD80